MDGSTLPLTTLLSHLARGPAHTLDLLAYLDPGSGSYVLQSLAAGFFALAHWARTIRARIGLSRASRGRHG